MVAYGIDEAWQRLTPAELKAAGKTFVVGYVGESASKNLTAGEVAAYHNAGIAVLLVYEYSTRAAESGSQGGTANGSLAARQAQALGYPKGCAIAYAIDEGLPNFGLLSQYARAFTNAVHAAGYRSMVYGGIATVKSLCDQHLVDLAWQTYAWSGGRWDPRVSIKQVQNGVTIAGKNVDLDVAVVSDYGAWMPGENGGNDVNLSDTFRTPSGETKTVGNFLGDGYDVLMNGKGPFAAAVTQKLADLEGKVGALATGAPTQDQVSAAVHAALADPAIQQGIAGQLAALMKAELAAALQAASKAAAQ